MIYRFISFFLFLASCQPALAFLSDYNTYQVPSVARPALDQPVTDPVFGSSLTRRSDPSQSEGSQGLIHEYAKFAGSNADNTLIAVQVIGGASRGAWRIQGLKTHTWLATLPTQGDPEISWHPSDRALLFYRKTNQLLRYHADTGTSDVLFTGSGYQTISDNEEGRPSLDWHYWAGIGTRDTGQKDIIVVDLQAGSLLATLPKVGALDWVTISMNGQYVVAQFTDGQGTRVYDRSLQGQRLLIADFTHADLALDASGQDILVYIAVTGAQITALGCPNTPNGSPIASARLSDGQQKILLGDCYDANWKPVITGVYLPWGGAYHFSGILSKTRPGWVLVSSYSDAAVAQMPFLREVFALKTDGSGAVERYAHHHSLTDSNYFAEPHATSSWDGAHLFFASTWGESARYDLYDIRVGSMPPPPIDNGTYTCSWVFSRRPDGVLTGFATQCVR